MNEILDGYWNIRLSNLKQALEDNNFEAYIAQDEDEASRIALEEIIDKSSIESISWGGSVTFTKTGLYDRLKERDAFQILDTFEKDISKEEKTERRRQALLVDMFITGTNAITESGQLVNLDMIGNRVGAITFGPKNVIIMVGRNKIVSDIHEAMLRVKDYASPTNTMRLKMNTPCVKTSYCQECKSPERICNTWTITEKSYPPKRTKVILINKDLGL